MRIRPTTFIADEESYYKFKKICRENYIKIGEQINVLIKQYIDQFDDSYKPKPQDLDELLQKEEELNEYF